MWNWSYENTIEGKMSAEAIWKCYANVISWPSWDTELEWSRLDGDFVPQAVGQLKPKGALPFSFTITKAVVNKEFSDVAKLPLGTTLEFHHQLVETEPGYIRITHSVHAKGLLAPILYFTLRRQLKKTMPRALKALLAKAAK